jgi:hypothetical protein
MWTRAKFIVTDAQHGKAIPQDGHHRAAAEAELLPHLAEGACR